MTIYYRIEQFNHSPLERFEPQNGIVNSGAAILLEVDYEAAEAGSDILELTQAFLKDPQVSEVQAIVIGEWNESFDSSIQPVIDLLIENASSLPALKALFVGEMTSEACEISWIQQADYSQLWSAFPKLEHFQVRGSDGLELGEVKHNQLKTLIIECGGLFGSILESVAQSELPELQTLELWLGDDNYGWEGTIEDVKPLLHNPHFSKIKYLGLRNSMIADDVATILANAEFIQQLEVLDLSMGTLGDVGAQALLDSNYISGLKLLDLHYHYVSDELQAKLKALPIQVDLSDPQEEDDYGRFVSVSE
ncbi:MAG: STM4015 family protein [Pseudomonadales bacterium]|nr:STM4015 family protein [Pseudomonadales bacterium]